MLSNTMEVEYSLDEFAKALAGNGYINDDSCFADIPSMLSAFESADVLNSPDSFPDSPCSNDDLSQVLEMAQIASPSLLESCLPDNFPYSKSFQAIPTSSSSGNCKTRDPCIANIVLNESIQNLTTALSCKDNNPSKDNCLVQNIANDTVSLDFNLLDAKENGVLDTSLQLTNANSQLSQINISTNSSASFPKQHPQHQQNTIHQHTSPLHPASSSESMASSTEKEISEPPASATKQKRKRKSKGYSRPAKSKKKNAKNNSETPAKPKPKKAKVSHDNEKHTSENTDLASGEGADFPQDDSGFESGEKFSSTDSCKWERTSHGSVIAGEDINSEQSGQDEPRQLRRSSRTTRNPENYNFRLSSLVKRVQTERRQQEPRQPKDKTKPPPLSKYRRRTANARERDRMREINEAFDKLKGSLPNLESDDSKQKITKFTILKLALNYIASLRDMLGYTALPSSLDDDVSSDLSSVRPASVTSSGSEDSCSSPTSGQSGTESRINDNPSTSSSMSDYVTQYEESKIATVTHELASSVV